ncbi:unnamed protein product [Haemonchus placei]|uniref:14_3_3 domain-containing protein n=1 Tax=Haemonchus placei TaxID=6290 RepID=A0A0N4X3A1_HAEPC|nr:unnamed protein product [Haemonchus placei]
MALPGPTLFSHPQRKGFEHFIYSFHMKYGGLGLQDEMLIHLMCLKQQEYAKDFVEALRAKLKENEFAQRTETYVKLNQLRKRSLVTDCCLKLEDFTHQVHIDASEKESSSIRALVTQLIEWKEYVQLFSTLELSKQEAAYEKLRNLAQSTEGRRLMAEDGLLSKRVRKSIPAIDKAEIAIISLF